jgi:hypothetical protein
MMGQTPAIGSDPVARTRNSRPHRLAPLIISLSLQGL